MIPASMTAVRNIDGISLFKDASLSIREGGGRLFRYLSVLFFLGSLSIDPLNAASQTSEPETINPAEWLAAQKKPSRNVTPISNQRRGNAMER